MFSDPFFWMAIGVGAIACLVGLFKERSKKLRGWDRMSKDLTTSQVESILGDPDLIVPSGDSEVWQYGTGPLAGAVYFSDGRVAGYKKPPLR